MSSDTSGADDTEEDKRKTKRILTRKLDLHLIPLVSAIYLFSYLIRSNISNAKLAGLEEGAHLSSVQYHWILSIFFFGYVIVEVPSNIILRRWRASRWIAVLLLLCGIVGVCMAATRNFVGLLICRFFLGIFEAGLFPGIIYYTSLWYSKKQQAIRLGIFWSFSALSGAFGGVFAYGISQIQTSKLGQWQLLFIIEGAPVIVLAVICWLCLPDSPERARFLTDAQRQLEIDRLANDAGAGESHSFSWSQVLSVFLDWKTYAFALIYISGTIPLQGVTLFLPTLVEDIGEWTALQAQLMTVPPYMAAFVAILVLSRTSDYFVDRSLHLVLTNLFSMCGLLLLMFIEIHHVAVLYVGVILVMIGLYTNVSIKIAWFNNNFASLTRRAVASAVIVSIGTIGGAISGHIYPPSQKPRYFIGNTIGFGCVIFQTVLVIILRFAFVCINHRRKQLNTEQIRQEIERYGGMELIGDRHPEFRYTL